MPIKTESTVHRAAAIFDRAVEKNGHTPLLAKKVHLVFDHADSGSAQLRISHNEKWSPIINVRLEKHEDGKMYLVWYTRPFHKRTHTIAKMLVPGQDEDDEDDANENDTKVSEDDKIPF